MNYPNSGVTVLTDALGYYTGVQIATSWMLAYGYVTEPCGIRAT
ncbi:MAG: hypothetical protein R2731_10300 [Nocardioides sp.]